MKLFLRKIFYFPLQPWFIKIISFFLYRKKNEVTDFSPLQAKSILIVKTDEIGDFVLASPFLRELRNNFPTAKITLLVKKEVFNLAEFCPYVDKVIQIDLRMNKVLRAVLQYFRMVKIGKKYLWKQNLELAIIPRWDGDDFYSTFFAALSGAKFIVGYNQKNGTEKLLDSKLEKDKVQHEVDQNLDIIRFLNGNVASDDLELWLSTEDYNFAEEILRKFPKTDFICIAPGASNNRKMYPVEKYILLINKILACDGTNYHILILGSAADKKLANSIIKKIKRNIIDFTGKTTLREAAAVISRSQLFIGNDSGLMHIAAAQKISLAAIFCHPKNGDLSSVNSPTRFSPKCEIKTVLQPEKALYPCKDFCKSNTAHCIKQISVEEIFQSAKNHFSRRNVI